MDRLAELKTLVVILEAGSLSAAARTLHRSLPSVSRDLADLERRTGVGLVERSTKRCRATPAGARLADQARQLLSSYDDALGEAAGERTMPSGTVRMTAPTGFGRQHVSPLVFAFLDHYPAISIDLHLTDRLVDMIHEEFDLAVRIGPLPDSPLVARRIGGVRTVVVASPAYLRARGTPLTPADLADHEAVEHTGLGAGTPWIFHDSNGRATTVPVTARLAVNQAETAIDAARSRRGLVRALSHQVDADLRAGRLVRILQPYEPEAMPVSLVWPPSRRSWRRMRLLVDHVAAGLGELDLLR
jgi:DNA-binding transcriptional LysR family regulator